MKSHHPLKGDEKRKTPSPAGVAPLHSAISPPPCGGEVGVSDLSPTFTNAITPRPNTSPPARRGERSNAVRSTRSGEGVFLCHHRPHYFFGITSSFKSLNRTSIGPPECTWKAITPRRASLSSLR